MFHLIGARVSYFFELSSPQGKEPNSSTAIKISTNLAFSCPSSNFTLFISNSEDQDTPVHNNEQEKDGYEATSHRKRNGFLAHGGDGLSSKRIRIITKEEEYMWSLQQTIANYENDNTEKYIPEKDVKETTLIKKNTKAREPRPS